MTLQPTSARTLTWASGIMLIAALMVGAPAGTLALSTVAALLALAPALFARGRTRLVAAAILLACLAAAVTSYPAYRREQSRYLERRP